MDDIIYTLTESVGYENPTHDPGLRLERGRQVVDVERWKQCKCQLDRATEYIKELQEKAEDLILVLERLL